MRAAPTPPPIKRSDAPPCPKVQIRIGKRHQFRLAGCELTRSEAGRGQQAGIKESIKRVESSSAAEFHHGVGAEPAIPLVPNAAAAKWRAIEPTFIDEDELLRHQEVRMRDIRQE